MIPTRVLRLEEARARFGDRADRLAELYLEGDALAEEAVDALCRHPGPAREAVLARALGGEGALDVPAPLARLVAEVSEPPAWVDFPRLERGGAVVLRAGPLSLYAFGGSLLRSYCSPAGNKPLVQTARLEQETSRRAFETARFIEQVCLPGGMQRGRGGWSACVRVRLMHAAVRVRLQRMPGWRTDCWGVPINQGDSAFTALLFSHFLAKGMAALGVELAIAEREDLLHLWRYVAHVLGVVPELQCGDEAETDALWSLLELTEGPPDEDSRRLARALVDRLVHDARTPWGQWVGERTTPVFRALAVALVGEERAAQLGIARSPLVGPLRAAAGAVRAGASACEGVDLARALALRAGRAYWSWWVGRGLGGRDAAFSLPQAGGRHR
jgi:hypothetical protein